MHAETHNPFTKRAITLLQIGEQEFEIEDKYLRRAQALAAVAIAIELEDTRELLGRIAEVLDNLVKTTNVVADEVSEVATRVLELQAHFEDVHSEG